MTNVLKLSLRAQNRMRYTKVGFVLLANSNTILRNPGSISRTHALLRSNFSSVLHTGSPQVGMTSAARDARGLAIDTISKCRSGHMGLPLGCAEIGAQLWGNHLSYFPEDPTWLNRDRFILSAGHGSMFLYSWLHMSGYALPMKEIQKFRQLGSMTPGHPEFPTSQHCTPGVEATTGPLGAGIGNAVGMAVAAKHAAARYNTNTHTIIDHHVIALCGDGCLQEGVAFEAASFAGHEGLDNLILIFDSNEVTLDKMASYTQSEDHALRFQAIGWNTVTIDGHDLSAIDLALDHAKKNKNGKPTLIIAKTVIGKGILEVEGTPAAHGEAGVAFQTSARARLGLPDDKLWYVSPETKAFFQVHRTRLSEKHSAWMRQYNAWKESNPVLATELEQIRQKKWPSAAEILASIPAYEPTKHVATRQSGSEILQHVARVVPQYLSGAADLHGSTKNYLAQAGDFGHARIPGKDFAGRNIHFGIREHGMGTILNGMAYYGLHRVSGATFLVFSDYMRPAIRIAALSELPVGYIFTHDSVAVGEDGPTHQPVETLSSLRLIPNLDVIRPADPEEVAGAFAASIDRLDGPTALILSRQNVSTLSEIPVETRRQGTLRGAYIAMQETAPLRLILLSSGSEVQHAMAAARELGPHVRVVSMPCLERFDRQTDAYRESILPTACHNRIAMEAGVAGLWYKYVGLAGKVIGVESFGVSAPGEDVMRLFGINKDSIIQAARLILNE